MAKTKDRSELEHLRGIIRDLEKQNRQLRSKLKQYEKSKHIYHDVITDYKDILEKDVELEKEAPKKKTYYCEKCHSGIMEQFEILNKTIGTCNSCGHRKRIK